MFETLQKADQDPLMAALDIVQRDPDPDKVDLSIGIYKDATGRSTVLNSVKAAETWLIESQETKSYLSSVGSADFVAQAKGLLLGEETGDAAVTGIQTVGGSGALRIGADLVRSCKPDARVWVPAPTWANHAPILSNAGLTVVAYPYYDRGSHSLAFDAMAGALTKAEPDDIVVLHGCCHNPSGADLTLEQWRTIAGILAATGAVPFVDLAYQGFGHGLDEDAAGLRHLAAHLPEMLIAASFSKNMSLYRDRIGALLLLSRTGSAENAVRHMARIVRTSYSMPPDHGAAVVAHILSTPSLRQMWREELDAMRARVKTMRRALVDALGADCYRYIAGQNGMFSFLDLTPEQVNRLRDAHHIYAVGNGRINIAGLTQDNVARVAKAIHEVKAA